MDKSSDNETNLIVLPSITSLKSMLPNDVEFTEREKLTLEKLKKLYLETVEIDVNMQVEAYKIENDFDVYHQEIYDRRYLLLETYKQRMGSNGDNGDDDDVLNFFWMKIMKMVFPETITKTDEEILKRLKDLRSKFYNKPTVRFTIEFYFEPNDFFNNTLLTKTYYLTCLPVIENPLTYEGAVAYKCEGCEIDWKIPLESVKENLSFFDFFSPPILPNEQDDPHYKNINTILQNDFEFGFYLKERVIPKAILFVTGEISDFESVGSDSEEESISDSVNVNSIETLDYEVGDGDKVDKVSDLDEKEMTDNGCEKPTEEAES